MRKLTPAEPGVPWPVRIRELLTRYGNLSLALLLALLVARAVELSGVILTTEVPPDVWNVVRLAFWSDLLFFLQLLVFLLPLFLLARLPWRGEHADLRGYAVVGSLALAAFLALVNYFFVARVPLGADLFGYSLNDILYTTRAGYRVTLLSVVSFTVPFAVFAAALFLLRRRTILPPVVALIALVTGFVLTVKGVSALPDRTGFKSEFAHGVALNKGAFFMADAQAYFFPRRETPVPRRDKVAQTKPPAPAVVPSPAQTPASRPRPETASLRYLDPRYPFLRAEDTPDVLGRYFRIDPSTPPNIVIIAVEGLGRAFSGPNAYLGSFTPFLDDLAGKSLYWENFLAAQGRTFASLPSILGSLPFGDKGFNDLGARMPKHLTLMSILKRNGYRTGFFCGNSLDFDNQRAFLERQNVDVMVGENDYDAGYYRQPGAYWGYADREVLQRAHATQRDDPRAPYLDYVQTVSMHTPYTVPGQEQYLRLFEERMTRLGFTDPVKEKYRQYRMIYSTILYTDAALRTYFEEQAKLPAYGNTIYIITGDHRLPEIPMSTKIDRYHVPLIIHSPLLKRSARIQSVSSQLDLAPSLMALLRQNYRLRAPDKVTWVGTGLDMEPSFRNVHRYPLKHTIHNLVDYLSGMYFLNENTLFALRPNMGLEPVRNEAKLRELRAEFDQYKSLNNRFRRELQLIPPDVYVAYFPER